MNPNRNRHQRITDSLEQAIWAHHPDLAFRISRFRQSRQRPARHLSWTDRLLLGMAVFLFGALLVNSQASAQTSPNQPADGMTLIAADGSRQAALTLNTDIRITVTGLVSRVKVVQAFVNDSEQWMEGVYNFPLPEDAAVDRMAIQVGDRRIEGEIQERELARRTYQRARQSGRTASLVEQQRPNMYTTRVANIGPHERIEVEIAYLNTPVYRDGEFSLRIPLTLRPHYRADAGTAMPEVTSIAAAAGDSRRSHHVSIEADINPGFPLRHLISNYHDVDVDNMLDRYQVSLADSLIPMDRDFELLWAPQDNDRPQAAMFTEQGPDGFYSLLMLVPPGAATELRQPREMILVVDTSGSMAGASLAQARSALTIALQALTPDERFNLIQFNSEVSSFRGAPVAASADNIAAAVDYVARLEANGGTLMNPAIEAALTQPVNPDFLRQVVFITDGSVSNEAELFGQIADQLGDARLFTVGIGSAPNGYFMRKAAQFGRGTFTHISSLDEVETKMIDLWSRIGMPALSDLCLQWDSPAEYYPQRLPDVYIGEPLWITARFDQPPAQLGVCGEYAGNPWSQVITPHNDASQDSIAVLWARRKIAALEDETVLGADRLAVREQILDVALQHGVLSRYTSLVAVDKTPARTPEQQLASQQLGNLLPAGSGTGIGFSQTATASRWHLIMGLLTALTTMLAAWWLSGQPGRQPPSSEAVAA